MKSNFSFREEARTALSGKWGLSVVVTLICYLVLGGSGVVLQRIFPVSSMLQILLMPMSWGFAVIFLRVKRGEKFGIENLFDGFKQYLRILGTMLLQALYTLLWMLLLIVPGIIKSISYAMTLYILADEPDTSYDRAITKSMEMMRGHKWQLFCLDLSFIGWFILSLLTLGIGFLWLVPYAYTAHAAFYEDIKMQNVEPESVVEEEKPEKDESAPADEKAE